MTTPVLTHDVGGARDSATADARVVTSTAAAHPWSLGARVERRGRRIHRAVWALAGAAAIGMLLGTVSVMATFILFNFVLHLGS
jgi:hypothetical protein